MRGDVDLPIVFYTPVHALDRPPDITAAMVLNSQRRVVFTDLDGTLLDHHNYDWREAEPALAALAMKAIPVCLVTSKTVTEVITLRRRLGNGHPFAVENGGAVAVPRGYFEGRPASPDTPLDTIVLGGDYDRLRALAVRLRIEYGYRYTGFGDMDDAAVVKVTGLDRESAAAARVRCASEPLLWQDSDAALADFEKRVAQAGYVTRTGGRFVHLLGHAHKGDALAWLRACYEAIHGPILAVAIGDSANDADMLTAADIGYWVARPDGSYQAPARGGIRHAVGIGPQGWREAIDALMRTGEL